MDRIEFNVSTGEQKTIPLTEAEVAELQARPPPPPNEIIKRQIVALEATISERRKREAILGIDKGWLADVNAQITERRASLK